MEPCGSAENRKDAKFDYMAAAEEAGRQLNSLIRQVPGYIKTALSEEWRRLPLLVELPNATKKMEDAIEEMQDSVAVLKQTVWAVAIVGIFAAVAIPVIAWLVTSR